MDNQKAAELLAEERRRVEALLAGTSQAARDDRDQSGRDGDMFDSAEPLTSEGLEDAVVDGLKDRLAALDRADQRLADGTYGRSIRSGTAIPDERLEADPAAELTVEEAQSD